MKRLVACLAAACLLAVYALLPAASNSVAVDDNPGPFHVAPATVAVDDNPGPFHVAPVTVAVDDNPGPFHVTRI